MAPEREEEREWIAAFLTEVQSIAAAAGKRLDLFEGDLTLAEQKERIRHGTARVAVVVVFAADGIRVSGGAVEEETVRSEHVVRVVPTVDDTAAPYITCAAFTGHTVISAHPDVPLTPDGLPNLAVLRIPPARWSELAITLPTAMMESPSPLVAPRVRSRKTIAPPTMQLLFSACGPRKQGFLPFVEGEIGGVRFGNGRDHLQIHHPEPVPLPLRNANVEKEALEAWARAGTRRDLERLDDVAWDVAALAVTAFYARTAGDSIDHRFPLMVEDLLEWRGVDPRKRSPELRQEVLDRVKLVCSERFHVFSETTLHLANPETGRKKKQSFIVKGPFLIWAGDLFRNAQRQLQLEGMGIPDGVLLNLGEWARKFVEEKAMLAIHLRRLAEYDLRRQLWERRIGQYLLFQMQNQASKSQWTTATAAGKKKTTMTPQHALKMRTVLDGAGIEWSEHAEIHPGRVIKQWTQALDTLKSDGVIGDYRCLDGPPDGGDLPRKGRLQGMLERRWLFLPGGEQAKHLKAKHDAAEKARGAGRKKGQE